MPSGELPKEDEGANFKVTDEGLASKPVSDAKYDVGHTEVITGADIADRYLIGISANDIPVIRQTLIELGLINWEFFQYEDHPELGLLVMPKPTKITHIPERIYKALFPGTENKDRISGSWWPDSTVGADTRLIRVNNL
jgi:hypothetical protein